MIEVTKINDAYARVDGTDDELSAVVRMVEHAVDIYDKTDLDYLVPWKAEIRHDRLRRLAKQLAARDEDSFQLDRKQFVAVRMVMDQLENREIPGVSAKLRDSVVTQVLQTLTWDIFDPGLA